MKSFLLKTIVFISLLAVYKISLLMVNLATLRSTGLNNYYGKLSGKPKLILVGASNLDYNYDYTFLNTQIKEYDVIGCNLNEPSGLYATLKKLLRLDLNQNDIIVFCLPHSFYESKKVLPIRTYKKIGFSTDIIYEAAMDFPKEALSAIFIDNKVEDVIEIYEKKRFSKKDIVSPISYQLLSLKEMDSSYQQCIKPIKNGPYNIESFGFEKDYLVRVFNYIRSEVPCQYVFRFPAALPDVNSIDEERLKYLEQNVTFINKFSNAYYSNDQFYNQTYHLNSCGREVNSNRLVSELAHMGFIEQSVLSLNNDL